jgi:hypothetical protein
MSAQTQQPIVRAPRRVAGTTIISPGITAAAQIVIPRFSAPNQYPSGKLVGTGPESMLAGTADTERRPVPFVVITEDAGKQLAEWQGGSTKRGTLPAIIQPVVRDLTIVGYDDTGGNYANSPESAVNDDQTNDHGKPDRFGLLWVEATGATVRDVNLYYAPGTAAYFGRPGAPRKGPTLPFDRIELSIAGLNVKRCYRGINNSAIDSSLTDCSVSGFRDYGVRMAGACLYSKLHVYGGSGKDDAIGVLIDGDANIGTTVYSEHCKTGLKITGKYNSLVGLYVHSCEQQAVAIPGAINEISSFRIQNCPLGFVLGDQHNKIGAGSISVTPGGTGIKLASGMTQVVRDVNIDLPDANSTGIDVEAELYQSTIVAHFTGGGVGLDLNDNGTSRLGTGNTIILTATRTEKPIDLPPNWDDQNNQIILNGRQVHSK